MSYSEISGLELFQMPFSSHASRQSMPSGSSNTAKQPVAATKATHQQSSRQNTVQLSRIQEPAAQAVEPEVPEVQHSDITHKNVVPENGCTASGSKKYASVPDGKTQADAAKQPVREQDQKAQVVAEAVKPPASVEQKEQPKAQPKEMVLDMSSGSTAFGDGTSGNADDTEKRKAHEAAEAKRKAEWDATQKAKKQAEEKAIKRIQSMSDADAICTSTRYISSDIERITRRTMKECVADHLQERCREDTEFARLTMHPGKSLINCFKYINRLAKEYIKQEMEDNDAAPENGIYGCDVPDGLVFDWAEDYYYDADAPEDKKKEERFVPHPYISTKTTASKTKKPAKEKPKQETSGTYEQMSFV